MCSKMHDDAWHLYVLLFTWGAGVVVPYEVPDNLSVAWYFSVLYVPYSVRWLRWITSRRWLISHVATMFCEGRRAQSLQCIKLGDATGPTGQPLKPQPALAGASESNRSCLCGRWCPGQAWRNEDLLEQAVMVVLLLWDSSSTLPEDLIFSVLYSW